jgi:hypothetical protein
MASAAEQTQSTDEAWATSVRTVLALQRERCQAYAEFSQAFKLFLECKDKDKQEEATTAATAVFVAVSTKIIEQEALLKELGRVDLASRIRQLQLLEKQHLEMVRASCHVVSCCHHSSSPNRNR